MKAILKTILLSFLIVSVSSCKQDSENKDDKTIIIHPIQENYNIIN